MDAIKPTQNIQKNNPQNDPIPNEDEQNSPTIQNSFNENPSLQQNVDENFLLSNNLPQENSQHDNEFFNNSFTNYNFANQSYINQNEDTPNSNNEESLCKESDNKNSVSGLSDKPWNRAAKDPTLIQKGTELFVGNLAMDTVEEDLYENFQDCGDIIDIRVHKNEQNKKCYAFLRFGCKEMIKDALNKNMSLIKGRKIKVTKSNENSTIFIGNIRKNWSTTDVELKVRRIFPNAEKIEHFLDNSNQGRNRGFCFVVFKNRNEAIKALNYVNSKGGINIDGVPLTCDWADIVDEDDSNSRQIFVSGLKENVDEFKVKEITDIVLSKNHKSSKRKDLAFITFETNEEARRSTENYDRTAHIEAIGDNICISLAFSQQAMQTKKKIKENRKKTHIPPQMNMPPNPKMHPTMHQIQNIHPQHNMNDKKNLIPQQNIYQNNLMIPPQNLNNLNTINPINNMPNMQNITNMTNMNNMPNIPNMPNMNNMNNMNNMSNINNMPNIPNMPNMQNMQNMANINNLNTINNMNPISHMQNKGMITPQSYQQNNINHLNQMNTMNNINPQLIGMQQMNQMNQMTPINNMNNMPQQHNMNNYYSQTAVNSQINPAIPPNINMNQNLNPSQLMYFMNYNNAYKVKNNYK